MSKESEYQTIYKKNHYKRIPLEVTPEQYVQIKEAADKNQESVNGYIKKVVLNNILNQK